MPTVASRLRHAERNMVTREWRGRQPRGAWLYRGMVAGKAVEQRQASKERLIGWHRSGSLLAES